MGESPLKNSFQIGTWGQFIQSRVFGSKALTQVGKSESATVAEKAKKDEEVQQQIVHGSCLFASFAHFAPADAKKSDIFRLNMHFGKITKYNFLHLNPSCLAIY